MDGETLKRLQDTEYEILCAVDDFCRENGISYALFCGTLLGAVRHGGFIPWDDDIDIVMTRSAYTEFCEKWAAAPLPGYVFQNFENDPYCVISHGKVRKDGTLLLTPAENPDRGHHGIWIDIFPLDKLSEEAGLRRKTLWQAKKIILLTRAADRIPSDGPAKRAVRALLRIIPETIRRRELLKAVAWLRRNHEATQSNYVWKSLAADWHIREWTFPQEMPETYEAVSFNGRPFPVFAEYEEMLKILYGDYMQLPPESERVCKHSPLRIEFE